ncbi:hypothetical protein [Arthrobacter dokdonensis]|uniref:hypothetical protein n=1 Tax=Arthrobacter dokdonellae TaxID=2211210 RepID=UPI000DE59694|nr:hypothetical protein [Arthrobacter dokdonellae]
MEDQTADLASDGKLDLTSDPEPTSARSEPSLERYNPDPQRDNVRKKIAYWLLVILTFDVVGAFVLLGTQNFLGIKTDDIRTLVELLFTPTVTLLGAVTGFYYATHGNKSGGDHTGK